jgi:hypothetical protein
MKKNNIDININNSIPFLTNNIEQINKQLTHIKASNAHYLSQLNSCSADVSSNCRKLAEHKQSLLHKTVLIEELNSSNSIELHAYKDKLSAEQNSCTAQKSVDSAAMSKELEELNKDWQAKIELAAKEVKQIKQRLEDSKCSYNDRLAQYSVVAVNSFKEYQSLLIEEYGNKSRALQAQYQLRAQSLQERYNRMIESAKESAALQISQSYSLLHSAASASNSSFSHLFTAAATNAIDIIQAERNDLTVQLRAMNERVALSSKEFSANGARLAELLQESAALESELTQLHHSNHYHTKQLYEAEKEIINKLEQISEQRTQLQKDNSILRKMNRELKGILMTALLELKKQRTVREEQIHQQLHQYGLNNPVAPVLVQ